MSGSRIVWTVGGLSKGKMKKGSKKLVKKVMKDKKYRRALKKEDVRSRKTAKTVATAAVRSVLRNHEVVEKRPSTLLLCAELLARVVGDRREAEKAAKKRAKMRNKALVAKWKRRGAKYDPKSGMVKLLKADRLPKMKRARPNKPRKK